MKRNAFFWIGVFGIALLILGFFDPAQYRVFPKCPFLMLTGYQCPGCGSQRALYQLLHGNVAQSIAFNFLLLPGLVYAGTGYLVSALSQNKWAEIQPKWYGRNAAMIALIVIMGYWLLRNIF